MQTSFDILEKFPHHIIIMVQLPFGIIVQYGLEYGKRLSSHEQFGFSVTLKLGCQIGTVSTICGCSQYTAKASGRRVDREFIIKARLQWGYLICTNCHF